MEELNDLNAKEKHPTRGLSDVIVDITQVSWIDGQNGRLYYRGINIAELATHSSFEETAYLLLCEKLPTKNQLQDFSWNLRNMNKAHEKVLRIVKELPAHSQPLHVLQMGLAALSCFEKSDEYFEEENDLEKVLAIIAQTSIILAAAYRNSINAPSLEPRTDLNYVDNFIYMISGKIPSKMLSRCIEIALIIQMDHGFNTSTFAARIVSSTLSNFYSATSAAVGALSGPLHGGASELVEDMLENAKASGDVRKYIQNMLQQGEKIVGMGHRVYKTTDPRAIILKDLLVQLTPKNQKNSDLKILTIIEEEASKYFTERMKQVHVNVDFWSGALYKKLGIKPIFFPAIFAAARVVGWCAHILELRKDNKLYRPKSHYVGEINLPYLSIERR